MQDRTQCGRFRLSGIRTRRRKVETLGPDFPERHVDITEIVITTAAGILALSVHFVTERRMTSGHDADPVINPSADRAEVLRLGCVVPAHLLDARLGRSEEHTSELQSPKDLVC